MSSMVVKSVRYALSERGSGDDWMTGVCNKKGNDTEDDGRGGCLDAFLERFFSTFSSACLVSKSMAGVMVKTEKMEKEVKIKYPCL